MKQVRVHLDDGAWREIKAEAASEGVSVAMYITLILASRHRGKQTIEQAALKAAKERS